MPENGGKGHIGEVLRKQNLKDSVTNWEWSVTKGPE